MTRGKKICNELRALRRNIANENGIPLDQPECTLKGECRGTCPHCESELLYLEQALSQRLSLGRTATVAGLSLTLAACGGVSSNDRPLCYFERRTRPRRIHHPRQLPHGINISSL